MLFSIWKIEVKICELLGVLIIRLILLLWVMMFGFIEESMCLFGLMVLVLLLIMLKVLVMFGLVLKLFILLLSRKLVFLIIMLLLKF